MGQARRALVICAHDDDEVIALGGTIRKMVNAGVQVSTMICATGNEGYTRLEEKDTIVERRRKERAAAQAILGTAACIAYEYHDFDNLDQEAVYRAVMQAVRTVRPQVVFSHLPTDYLAHRTLARVAPEAVWQAEWECSLDLGEPWAVQALYQFSVLEMISKPSHIVDISDTFAAKVEAIHAYESQHQVVPGVLQQIEAKARAYGSLIGVQYGEALVRSQFIPVRVDDPAAMFYDAV
jgi:LmbE family N-acetylglucosaminyl deacetylase